VGSRCGDFEPAIAALVEKAIPVERLVSKVYPFRDIVTALEESARREVCKVLVDFREIH